MSTFELYRYQLLPASQQQQDLFQTMLSADQIRERKNEFLDAVLGEHLHFRHRGLEIKHKVELHDGPWFMFKIGAHKSIDRDTADFRRERIESWPNITVIVHNDSDTQIIAISKNIKAFSSTKIVAKLFEHALTSALRSYGLTVQIREQFEKHNFWSIIDNYSGKIARVKFEMVAPNMANISRTLKIDFKQLNRDSNCQKVNLELEALPGATLEIKPDNELVDGCVEYASLGGGDIAIKIRGIKKEIRTSTTVKSVEVDEIFIKCPDDKLLSIIKQIL
ncbi:hypothetical protein [Vogesella indigofera]|uniref:hypothetical protein n=1 Tax=Vogesella indigofera TaxID=45465 RepID=UPI00234F33CF|nr:hypothetical protein [Vogesella indigofera]MDC7697435.1 hypothetical protein [Vogesella indigofera]